MALTYGFYNSVSGDRAYNALELSRLFSSMISDGVMSNVGNCFEVLAGSGMAATVGTGRCWFSDTWTDNDALYPVAFNTAHPTLPRIDSVILVVNKHSSVRSNSIAVKQGIAATTPVQPNIVRDATRWEVRLANVLIPAGSTSVVQGNITNVVGTEDTPFITGILQTVSTDIIVARWEAMFDAWLDTLRDQLDENQAGNLQNQITVANNTLLDEVVSTGTFGEMFIADIPGGFDVLRITGLLKSIAIAGNDVSYPEIRLNDETGTIYAKLDPVSGQWVGWDVNTSINTMPVVTSLAKNAYIYTPFTLEIPMYDSPSVHKWVNIKTTFAGAYPTNPRIPGEQHQKHICRLGDPVTKVSISGQFMARVCWIKAYGCAI